MDWNVVPRVGGRGLRRRLRVRVGHVARQPDSLALIRVDVDYLLMDVDRLPTARVVYSSMRAG
jgi:hypothetical protein